TGVTINGMVSIGDWKWTSNVQEATVFDINGAALQAGKIGPVYTKGIHVGDQPQTTLALGATVNLTPDLKIGADYNYFDRFYSSFQPTALTRENFKPWQVPSYSLVDVNAVFRFKFSGVQSSFFANVNNLL